MQLNKSWQEIRGQHDYPPSIANTLGQALAATTMLTATVKVQGRIILELRGNKGLKFLSAECTSNCDIRGIGRWDAPLVETDLHSLTDGGQLVISIVQDAQPKPYQGIVSLESGSLAGALAHYFGNSEQLATSFWLAADERRATGLMLQKLPEAEPSVDEFSGDDLCAQDADGWNRISLLAKTLTSEELLQLSPQQLLTRLFHDERVRVFPETDVAYRCSCSRQRVGTMLRLLGAAEVRSVIADNGLVDVTCEFCGHQYIFDPIDALALFHAEAGENPDQFH